MEKEEEEERTRERAGSAKPEGAAREAAEGARGVSGASGAQRGRDSAGEEAQLRREVRRNL